MCFYRSKKGSTKIKTKSKGHERTKIKIKNKRKSKIGQCLKMGDRVVPKGKHSVTLFIRRTQNEKSIKVRGTKSETK